ncbi:MAG: hypothetical protein EP332_14815 [Bacteroidetes bacterium]|nr:MAG: hypothetical protein EP332_14815 [Bacteroidota bacterium]
MGIITTLGEKLHIPSLEKLGRDFDIKKQIRLYNTRQKELEEYWKENPNPSNVEAPHTLKQKTILEIKSKYNTQVLIETGTYLGKMMESMQPHFKNLYSIEISQYLNHRAKKLFGKHTNLNFVLGDSGAMMKSVIDQLNEPILFWLDGHYSGGITGMSDVETPIAAELKAIFSHPLAEKHVILIDDARMFNGTRDYPSIDELKEFIKSQRPDFSYFEILNDIVILKSDNL